MIVLRFKSCNILENDSFVLKAPSLKCNVTTIANCSNTHKVIKAVKKMDIVSGAGG